MILIFYKKKLMVQYFFTADLLNLFELATHNSNPINGQ